MAHTLPAPDAARELGLAAAERRGRRMRRWLALAALLALAGAAAGAYAWLRPAPAPRFVTQPAQVAPLVVKVTATGTLQPVNQVDVGSELSGIVRTVEADFNDRVKAGQVLARLDAERLKAQVLQSEAVLESARARVLQAQTTVSETGQQLERTRALVQREIVSEQALVAAEASYKRAQAEEAVARADVSKAAAALNADRINLAKSVIRAPIDGIVLARNVEPGQTVAATLQAPVLFVLAEDLRRMELTVDVDEADVGQVRVGQRAAFTVDAHPDRTFSAKVTKVRFASQTVAGVVTYTTLLDVDNAALLLRPGMTATADITVLTVPEALLVPNAALRFTPPSPQASQSGGLLRALIPRRPHTRPQPPPAAGKDSRRVVWTLRGGQPVAVHVRVGPSDGRSTQVLEGDLRPGEPLLVDLAGSGT